MAAKFEDTNHRTARNPNVPSGVPLDLQDDIVISGISGRLPNSPNIEEFKKNLFEGVDCVTEEDSRWPPGLYNLPVRLGKMDGILAFDTTFFSINPKQASVMDPQLRILLELTHEAIIDAGFNPASLRGTKTGVFIGASNSEASLLWSTNVDTINGYSILGCIQNMFSNRISYTFDLKGPSYTTDSGCSSSFSAVHQAINAMRGGECDAAIVGATNLILSPAFTLQYHRMNMLSLDGKCKVFDADADGYVRSDAAVVMLLQKSKDARRVYASIVKTKINGDGHKIGDITAFNGEMQYELMHQVYDETGINPGDISYVETNAIGIRAADSVEANSIASIFCKDRKDALLIGSVKSNIGHPLAASGLCSIAKVLIAIETGMIPPNLHYKTPNPDIPGLADGRLRVVNKITPWNGNLVALNSFSYSGLNVHMVLRGNPKPKLSHELKYKLPKLVTVSGRTKEAVNYMLDGITIHEQDDEFLALLRDIHCDNIPGHLIRGSQILGNADSRQVDDFRGPNRPIWFVFSGMGSQWEGMGRQLLSIETFRRSLERCAAALKPVNIDLMDLILHGTNDTYYNISNCFVSIAAVQVGLVDLLTFLDVHPDGIVGHSFGELGCAYADGTITAEQMVLAAYWRGKSVLDSDSPPGAMAAVGLSWEEATNLCPPGVYPVCHNSADSVTISGPIEATHNFVKDLQAKDIFAKIVNSSGYAFHSRYIETAGPKLSAVMEELIPHPKKRSPRWISSSIPESDWGGPLAKYSSAAYHVNNLLSPVLFHGTTVHIPDNAIAIEIGPHGLLQAILRRSLSENVTNIGLQKRNHKDNLSFFLNSIGKLYVSGGLLKISNLYPPINYPVGRGTPMISSLVKWDHSIKWSISEFASTKRAADYFVDVDLSKENDAFITDHRINGKIAYPVTGYIMLIWETFAKLKDMNRARMPVIIENVRFQRVVNIPEKGTVKFVINIFSGNGDFEISEGGSTVVSGKIRCLESNEKKESNVPPPAQAKESQLVELTKEDIYKEFRLRGYDYDGIFQGIIGADNQGIIGKLDWCENWISFMNSMFQFCLLGSNTRDLYLLTRIQYLSINPIVHMKLASENSQEHCVLPIYNYKSINCLKSGGVEMSGLMISLEQRRQQMQENPKLERYIFIPYENNHVLENTEEAQLNVLDTLLQIVCDNLPGSTVNVVEVAGDRESKALLTPHALDILYSQRKITIINSQLITTMPDKYTTLVDQSAVKIVENVASAGQDLHLVLAANVLSIKNLIELKNLSGALKTGGFIILEESSDYDKNLLRDTDLKCVAVQRNSRKMYVLLKKIEQKKEPIIIQITEKNFSWLKSVKAAMKKAETNSQEILLVNQGEEQCGIVGFMNCLRLESSEANVRYVFIQDQKAPKFSLTEPFYAQQISKQMMANVLRAGRWGCYRHLCLEQKINTPCQQVEHAFVNTLVPGDLSSLCWIESSLSSYQSGKHTDTEMCSVYYAPLNFNDIISATGEFSPEVLPSNMRSKVHSLGLEFSGRDSTGRRVMGLAPKQGLATTVAADSLLMWKVPDKWTLEEAATIPVAYATSYYALFVWGCLKPGESVLIHAGSTDVGLASITLAFHTGCTVFTTVDSLDKRNFLMKTFPKLTDRNIGSSRDTNFEYFIMNETNGRGVDVILNSLSKEKLQASVRCLATDGRFLDIGKYCATNVSNIGMSIFLRNISFNNISLDSLFESSASYKKELARLIKDGIKNGAVRPLPVKIFSENQISEASSYMTTGKHIGKVLLKIREEEPQKVVPQPSPKTVMAIPRTYMDPNKSYIVVGGLGGFGLEFANWMIERGAKYIILTSRFGIRTGYQTLCVRRWRESGVNVIISTSDCTALAGAEQLIKESNKIAPVGGIFSLAAVLNGGLIGNLNEDNFKTAALPKINITKNLDVIVRKSCPSLDYFVVFSSVTCGRGSIGQSNYGFADSAMERIVEKRTADGLPGLAIQWGTVGDINGTAEDNKMKISDTPQRRISNYLSTMDTLLRQSHPVLSCVV